MRSIFITGIIAICCLKAVAQSTGNPAEISRRLTIFEQTHIVEKAYLQFDKPYYAAGDTIYFKAYVTAGELHKFSVISGVLHVDLINTENKIDQSIKLQLDSGIAWGDFASPDSLPAGNYHIRAYTQWMRNASDDSFFEKLIPVGQSKPAKIPESLAKRPAPATKPDIQFLPEGGTLIAGIDKKIAFKAVGPDGLGIAVKGIVDNNEGEQVATFASQHLGMGCFYLKPERGKTYTAKISYTNGIENEIALPKPEDGIALSVNNDAIPVATATLAAGEAYFSQNKGKPYTLLIASGGLITTVNCELDSPTIKLDILKRKLRTGIATITLFSSANEPLAERLFFVQNYDQPDLQLKAEKSDQATREMVSIHLKATNRKGEPDEGHFSASVINESVVPDDRSNSDNILTSLLLTSDLKGYIEQPAYYFSDTTAAITLDLDLLMLTQGYRHFEWKQVLDTTSRQLAYQPENGITITGRVDNLSDKPIANAGVNLIRLGAGFLSGTTDGKGVFRFSNLFFTDSARFVLNATNDKGKNLVKISLLKDVSPAVTNSDLLPAVDTGSKLSAYVENDQMQLATVRTQFPGKVTMLKQVNIHSKPLDNQYRTESLAGAGNADQVMHADEIEKIGGELRTSLDGRLRGVRFSREGYPYLEGFGGDPMLLVIDGFEFDPRSSQFDLNQIPSTLVETIEVLKYASTSMYGMAGGHGVLVITTKQRMSLKPGEIPAVGVLPLNLVGFYKARQFYSPKYDTPEALASKQRDLRSTIYWQPELNTDKNGSAEFEYYNADTPGTYKITIEGIDKDGNIGRQVYRYQVK